MTLRTHDPFGFAIAVFPFGSVGFLVGAYKKQEQTEEPFYLP
jgi:hypothetical protein